MPINTIINLKVVKSVAEALGDLKDEVLFIGGSVASLYAFWRQRQVFRAF